MLHPVVSMLYLTLYALAQSLYPGTNFKSVQQAIPHHLGENELVNALMAVPVNLLQQLSLQSLWITGAADSMCGQQTSAHQGYQHALGVRMHACCVCVKKFVLGTSRQRALARGHWLCLRQ